MSLVPSSLGCGLGPQIFDPNFCLFLSPRVQEYFGPPVFGVDQQYCIRMYVVYRCCCYLPVVLVAVNVCVIM